MPELGYKPQPFWFALCRLPSDVINFSNSSIDISSSKATVVKTATKPRDLVAGTPYKDGSYIVSKHNYRPMEGTLIELADVPFIMTLPDGDWSLATSYFETLATGVIDQSTPQSVRNSLKNKFKKGGRR